MKTAAHRNAYYVRARGSAVEVDNHVELSWELQYLIQEQYDELTDHCARLAYLITRLIDAS